MPTDRSDDELLSQIDELKARMDRLMSGGTSTSNSAVLTDQGRAQAAEARRPTPPAPPPARTTVKDLVPPEDREVLEAYPKPSRPVPFPDARGEDREADRIVAAPQEPPRAESPSRPEPDQAPPAPARGGSVVEVEEQAATGRPQAATFDDLGNVIKEELARDETVPPEEPKRGPGLASRFGGEDEYAPPEEVGPPVPDDLQDDDVPAIEPTDEDEAELAEPEDEPTGPRVSHRRERSRTGTIAAIWVGNAVASGAIATLHFTGVI